MLEAASNVFSSHATFAKCSAGIVSGQNRHHEKYLRDIFARFKDASGGLAGQNLIHALQEVDAPTIPTSVQEVEDIIKQFDANSNGVLEFGEFQQVANEPDELQMWLGEKQLPIAADALRPLVGRGSDQLQKLRQLSAADIDHAATATCAVIPSMLKELHQELQAAFAVQSQIEADMQADPSKFNDFYKMACGTITDFHKGLTGRVGMPQLNFKNAMRQEHCERAGCDVQFTTGNYKITTNPRQEWQYIVESVPCPNLGHERRIIPISELMQQDIRERAKLCEEEVIAIVLYTGPMFQIYNTILRQYPEDKFAVFRDGDNLFSTTIFVLVSAVQKLSRCTRIPLGTQLYRGLGGKMDLPDIFFQTDNTGCSGYAEWGFLSTTSDRDVALGYSGVNERRPKAMVMVIETSSIDRGADISNFSQYPGEKEFLYLPCSFVQRTRHGNGRVQVVNGGLVAFLAVKINLNIKTQTVEELQEQKKSLHMVSARAMVEEVRYELGEWAKSAEALKQGTSKESSIVREEGTDENYGDYCIDHVVAWDDSTARHAIEDFAAFIVEECKDVVRRHEAAALKEFVNDAQYRMLVSEILDSKAWAKEKKELWMRDSSRRLNVVRNSNLFDCHAMWLEFLLQNMKFDFTNVHNQSINTDFIVDVAAQNGHAECLELLLAAGGDVNKCNNYGFFPIFIATQNGHAECLKLLLDAGGNVNINKCDKAGRSPIFIAVEKGYAECLKLLLDAGGDVNKCNNDGQSPIYKAVDQRYAECLKLLLAAGGDINKCDNDGQFPIYKAVDRRYADCLKLLLAAGGDVNKCIKNGESPIHKAVDRRYADCLKLLLAAGGDVNKCNDFNGESPIHKAVNHYVAADNDDADCLLLLLAAGGDVNKCNDYGKSPIYVAAEGGHAEYLKLLLAAGGDVNKCNQEDKSPIYVAAERGDAEFLKLLLAAGGDVNKCNEEDKSPIYVAAEGGHAECLKLLLAAGGDVNKRRNDDRTLLHGASPIYVAVDKGHAECLKLLLAAGGDVNTCIKNGESPIYNAVGYAECLKLLLAAGGDVNKCRNDGESPIYKAVDYRYAEGLQLLLAAGGDVNKCNEYGESPIYVAANRDDADCLKLLLAAGGDVNKCCDFNGESPIYVAAKREDAECLKLLLAAGGDVNKCNNDGESPICVAANRGHADCLKLLLASRANPRSSFGGVSVLDIARHSKHTECVHALEDALS